MKVLIAEDDLTSRKFLSKFLSKYGECDLALDGPETINAFLMALKDKKPYHLICLDITDKPTDTKKLIEALEGLGLIDGAESTAKENSRQTADIKGRSEKPSQKDSSSGNSGNQPRMKTNFDGKDKNTSRRSIRKNNSSPVMANEANQMGYGYFKSVHALSDYQLEVTMETGTTIHFKFLTRLNTARFGMLRDEELFRSVRTDGNYLIFNKAGRMPVKITALEFMDLVLVDRTKLM